MTRIRDVRLAGWAGISTVPLILIPFFITGRFPKFFPYLGDSTNNTFTFMSSNVSAIRVQAMAALSLPLYVWFAAGLVELVHAPGQSTVPTRLVGWGTVTAIAVSIFSYASWVIPTFRLVHDPGQADLVRALVDVGLITWYYVYPSFALVLLGSGLAILRSTALPRWLGICALVLAAVEAAAGCTLLLTHGPLQPGSLFGVVTISLYCLWVPVVGVAMVRWASGRHETAGQEERLGAMIMVAGPDQ
jgi:hypothetical protein